LRPEGSEHLSHFAADHLRASVQCGGVHIPLSVRNGSTVRTSSVRNISVQ
jgi:hypothetical protein